MPRLTAGTRLTATNRPVLQNGTASLYFNGSSSLMTSPVVPDPTGFSFAMWMKLPNPKAGSARIMDYSDSGPSGGLTIAVNSTMRPEVVIYDGASTTTTLPITLREWVHVAVTYVPNSAKLYLNGELATTDSAVNMSAATQTLTFGRRSASAANFASVFLSQIVLHNTTTPWTAAQVLALYQSGTIPTGATAVYPLNEGGGTVAYDTSGNGNNGTITSGTWTRDTPTKTRKPVNQNMVYNGDFEIAPVVNVAQTTPYRWLDGTAGGIVASGLGNSTNRVFGVYYWDETGQGSIMLDNTVKKNGNYSLKVSTLATGSVATASLGDFNRDDFIPVLPSTSYTYSFWMKTNYVSGDASEGARVNFTFQNGVRTTTTNNYTTSVKTTTDWTQYTGTLTTLSTTRFMSILPNISGSGGAGTLIMDAWFDDIQLYPTTAIARSAA